MPYIMLYDTWMERTEVRFRRRSSELKDIDAALKAYHERPVSAGLARLRIALHNWKVTKGYSDGSGGAPWINSIRNQKGAVELLDSQLYGFDQKASLTTLAVLADLPFYGLEMMADNEARIAMQEARTMALHTMFNGREMKTKPMMVMKAGYALKRQIDKVRKNANEVKDAAIAPAKEAATSAATEAFMNSEAGPIYQRTKDMVIKIVKEIVNEVLGEFPHLLQEALHALEELVPNFVGEVAAAIAPYASVVKSAAYAVYNTGAAAKAAFDLYDTGTHLQGVNNGDPQAAAHAILRLIERGRNQHTALAGIYATDAAVKSAAIAADAATWGAPTVSTIVTPLQGFATSLMVLTIKIRAVIRNLIERKRANKLMSQKTGVLLTPRLFEVNPLLGCYFIAASSHSDIINFLVEDIGEKGWMYDVETLMKKHVKPLQETARKFIDDAIYEIPGLSSQQGARTVSKWEMLKRLGHKKKHMDGFGSVPTQGKMQGFGTAPV